MSDKKVKVLFGLKAQGHIETIELMLNQYKGWDEIGKAIGWVGSAAHEAYTKHLQKELATLRDKAAAFDELSKHDYIEFKLSGHREYLLDLDGVYDFGGNLLDATIQAIKADSDKGVSGD